MCSYEYYEKNKVEVRKLEGKIRFLEDKLLRSKNHYEIENLNSDLGMLRKTLARLKYETYSLGS